MSFLTSYAHIPYAHYDLHNSSHNLTLHITKIGPNPESLIRQTLMPRVRTKDLFPNVFIRVCWTDYLAIIEMNQSM